jgi:chromate transporter
MTPPRGSAWEVLAVAARLGLTSFGGPVAHLGYFHAEYVVRRRWLDERTYADLVALCQFLPGPASSQVGMAVGLLRAGLPGALAAWIGFTLPSAAALVLFAYAVRAAGVPEMGQASGSAWAGVLHGLNVVAVAVVVQAVWGMARSLCPDRPRATLAAGAACLILLWPAAAGPAIAQLLVIALGALAGWRLLGPLARDPAGADAASSTPIPVGRRTATLALALLAVLLVALPVLRRATGDLPLAVFDAFFRTGALVFGGGHVVLPLLQAEVVPPGWLTDAGFVAGYGAAQAVPGPLFTFAAYLGALLAPADGPGGPLLGPLLWGALALVAVFLPSLLLVLGALPFWEALRRRVAFRAALLGINAAVVGLLGAALYQPVWASAIGSAADVALALAAFALLAIWKLPAWLVVALTAAGGLGLSLVARLGGAA